MKINESVPCIWIPGQDVFRKRATSFRQEKNIRSISFYVDLMKNRYQTSDKHQSFEIKPLCRYFRIKKANQLDSYLLREKTHSIHKFTFKKNIEKMRNCIALNCNNIKNHDTLKDKHIFVNPYLKNRNA